MPKPLLSPDAIYDEALRVLAADPGNDASALAGIDTASQAHETSDCQHASSTRTEQKPIMTSPTRPTTSMPLPATPSQITAAWLESVMGVGISSVSVEAIGTGQTAATYRITPTYSRPSQAPRSLIAKLPSQDQGVRDRVALGYRAEHAFHTRVADTVDVPLPRVYHCDIGSDGSEFVLLLFRPGSRGAGRSNPRLHRDRSATCG